MNNYPRNTKSDQTSSHKNPIRLLQNGQSWFSGKKYKLLLSQYYNIVFEKTTRELPESETEFLFC